MKIDSIEDLVPGWLILLTFVLIILLSFLCNASVALAIYWSRSLKYVTSMFMISLSLSNMMVGVINTSLALVRIHWQDTISGFTCQVSLTIELYSVVTSIFSLLSVSVDRYVAVIHPTKKFHMRIACGVLAVIWVGGFLYASRFLFLSFDVTTLLPPPPANGTVINNTDDNNSVTGKSGGGSSGDVGGGDDDDHEVLSQSCNFFMEEETDDLPYRAVDLVVLFIIPFTAMSYMYSCIGKKLWGKNLAATQTVRRKRKVVKLLIASILIFFFSWIPFYLIEFISDSLKVFFGEEAEIDSDPSYYLFRFGFILIALSSAFMIPTVYVVFYDTLRDHIRGLCASTLCRWYSCATIMENKVGPLRSEADARGSNKHTMTVSSVASGVIAAHSRPRSPGPPATSSTSASSFFPAPKEASTNDDTGRIPVSSSRLSGRMNAPDAP